MSETPNDSPATATPAGPGVVFAIIVTILIPAFLTLRTVESPGVLVMTSDNPTPFGYTWSLTLWLIPLLVMTWWLHANPRYQVPRAAFWTTVGLLVPLGVLLDLFLGNAFFTFPNAGATLEIFVYGYDLTTGEWVKNIPIEEFGFYLFGIAVALLMYLWADLFWFGRYNQGDTRATLPPGTPMLKLHWPSALLGLALIIAGIFYKKCCSPDPGGFPGYFVFLIAVAFTPAALLYDATRSLINWRAFSFSALTMFLISMLWEATIAFPYGWWGYKSEMMLGLFIEAWQGLPVEEPFLWLLVSFTTVIVFEAIHILIAERHAQRGA